MSDKPKKLKRINEAVNMTQLNEMMAERVYLSHPMSQSAQIIDTKKCFNLAFCGTDMVVHAMTWWDDTKHDNVAANVQLKMAQDTRTLDLRVFDKNHTDDFIEAVQDAAIAASTSIPVIHDDEGFPILRCKMVEVVSGENYPYRTTMPSFVGDIRSNGRRRIKDDTTIVPAAGWSVNIERRNAHYELLDAISMVFSVVGMNNRITSYQTYRHSGMMRNGEFYIIGEMMELLKAAGGYEDPNWASAIIAMLKDETNTVEVCRRHREYDKAHGKKSPEFDPFEDSFV